MTSDRHGLLPPDELAELRVRADGPGLLRLAVHVGTLAALVGLGHVAGSVAGPLALALGLVLIVVQGAIQSALFAPLHESVHHTAFRSRRLNEAVAFLTGLILILPARYFRAFHFAHHRHTQDPVLDPELGAARPQTVGQYLWVLSGLRGWVNRARELVTHARGRVTVPFVPARSRNAIVREARITLAIYLSIAGLSLLTGSTLALWGWLLPAIAGQPFIRMYLLAEHTGCALTPEPLANTRTMHTNALVRLYMWNMPYHAEHHLYPAVPFHQLPRLHRHVGAHLRHLERGYLRFQHHYIRTLREPAGDASTPPRSTP